MVGLPYTFWFVILPLKALSMIRLLLFAIFLSLSVTLSAPKTLVLDGDILAQNALAHVPAAEHVDHGQHLGIGPIALHVNVLNAVRRAVEPRRRTA